MDLDWDVSSRGSQQHHQQQRRLSIKLEGDDCQDDPEELIRGDAKAVNFIRCLLIAVLVTATVLSAVANCTLLARLEMRAFSKDFESISKSLIQSFLENLTLNMFQAASLSVTFTFTGADVLHSSVPFFDQLYQYHRATSNSSSMVFSPLLYDEAARETWESYARDSIQESQKNEKEGIYRYANRMRDDQDSGSTIKVSFHNEFETTVSKDQCSWDGETENKMDRGSSHFHHAMGNISQIFDLVDGVPISTAAGPRPYSPAWQVSSVPPGTANLYNQMSDPIRREAIEAVIKQKSATLTRTTIGSQNFDKLFGARSTRLGPEFSLFYPVFSDLKASHVIGTIGFGFSWTWFLQKVIPVGSEGIDLVLENSCGQTYSFSVDRGKSVTFLGEDDLHETTFEHMKQGSTYEGFNQLQHYSAPAKGEIASTDVDCKYRLYAYPSAAFLERYKTSTPGIVTAVMLVIFLLTAIVFFVYDRLVRRLQNKVMRSAVRYNSFLSTLFPSTVRSRLFNTANRLPGMEPLGSFDNDETKKAQRVPRSISFLPRLMVTPKLQLKNFLELSPSLNIFYDGQNEEPIADLFSHTTVFFADIAGFTAWSSEREPLYVFKLLETLYSAFDRIAARLGVFKVETVGDCYVAVTGLPEPQEDHAVIMAMFANECLSSMRELTRSLESMLGPSTASLALRVGMHSGPVIAGVLRGEKSRFQLFGDTMNTASRMESTGVINRIHVSQTTADLLRAAGKTDWITPREDHVFAKGKGLMTTYWVSPDVRHPPFPRTSLSSCGDGYLHSDYSDAWGGVDVESAICSLVDWNVDLLRKHLQKIVASRGAVTAQAQARRSQKSIYITGTVKTKFFRDSYPRDEVVEALPMPEFSDETAGNPIDPALVRLPESVVAQLRSFVTRIAATYHMENTFHNFEHASHVAMSSSKLLNRIIAPDGVDYNQRSLHKAKRIQAIAKEIHETTFGISSDPLLQFAAVFSALIHDVDHDGVPNAQLSVEKSPIAEKYKHKTVAEQHSVDMAWCILMDEQYQDLRSCIYETEAEMLRFRQLVVNAVIATDIADDSLQVWRERRWDRAFHSDDVDPERPNRKASIVYAYILQASDVAHTMQHWHTYRKWNERLFVERYHAYQKGRSLQDPSLSWYEDEIQFFEHYVIPLAQKLEECGVFGVSSHEYLSYAVDNRDEWVSKGQEIVKEMVAKFSRQPSGSKRARVSPSA